MTYIKEQCPVCKNAFTPEDDVVVCPQCGTPHHRACYEENMQCANTEKHAKGFEWTPQVQPMRSAQEPLRQKEAAQQADGHRVLFCPNCGRENPAEEPVCIGCGARLYNTQNGGKPFVPPVELPNMFNQPFANGAIPIAPTDKLGSHTVGDCAEFIGVSASKYIPKLYKAEKEGKKVSWNWAAFLLAPYWFFYRKMPNVGAVCMLILLAATMLLTNSNVFAANTALTEKTEAYYAGTATQQELVEEYQSFVTLPENIAAAGVSLAIHIYAGLFGNLHYKKKIEREVTELQKQATSTEQYRVRLFRRGGVSGMLFALSYVGFNCALQIATFLVQKYIFKM